MREQARFLVLLAMIVLPLVRAAPEFTGDVELNRLIEQGRWAEAESLARKAVVSDTGAAAWSALGRVLFFAGRADQLAEARSCLERATELDPERASAWYWLGRVNGQAAGQGSVANRARRAGNAGDCFARALDLEPTSFVYAWALLRFRLQAPDLLGGDRVEAGQIAASFEGAQPDAKQLLTAAVELEAGSLTRTLDLLRSVEQTESAAMTAAWRSIGTELGEILLRREEWSQAVDLFVLLTGRYPEDSAGWYGLGRALEGKGDPEAAAAAYARYLEQVPDGPRADAIRRRIAELED